MNPQDAKSCNLASRAVGPQTLPRSDGPSQGVSPQAGQSRLSALGFLSDVQHPSSLSIIDAVSRAAHLSATAGLALTGASSAFAQCAVQPDRAAADTLRLAPTLATAQRVNGFIAYWRDREFAAAQRYFERAIALAPGDATGHFWYGNILADHGDSAPAPGHLRQAQTMMPGWFARSGSAGRRCTGRKRIGAPDREIICLASVVRRA